MTGFVVQGHLLYTVYHVRECHKCPLLKCIFDLISYCNIYVLTVFLINDELLLRLANGKSASIRPVVINKANETTAPLDYHSPPDEVQGWLRAKGFND